MWSRRRGRRILAHIDQLHHRRRRRSWKTSRAATAEIGVEGPRLCRGLPGQRALCCGESASGAAGVPHDRAGCGEGPACWRGCWRAGCVEASAEDVAGGAFGKRQAALRRRNLSEAHLAQETGLLRTLCTSNKGCYLGQEIVEHVRSRGHVNKHAHAAARGRRRWLLRRRGQKDAGGRQGSVGEMVTAAFFSALWSAWLAFAYLRPEFAARRSRDLSVAGRGGAGRPARLATTLGPPFAAAAEQDIRLVVAVVVGAACARRGRTCERGSR